jgi:hypothetical protein
MRRVLTILGASLALVLTSGVARAQVIAAAGQVNAERIVNGADVGQYTRPVNLNQLGINYSDCIQDMVLQFTVTLSGFTGNDNMQIWATYDGDCTADTTRGIGTTAATCWLVNTGETIPNFESPQTRQYNVPVRALVGPEGGIPTAGTLVGDSDATACNHQGSFAAVPITVWFLPLLPGGQLDTSGTAKAYSYPVISADLVGPPAPVGVSIADGDTLFIVNWTPNSDADTQGYDVFIDPAPGTHTEAGVSTQQILYCPEGGASSTVAADDASADATTVTTTSVTTESPDACVKITGGGSVPSTSGTVTCTSLALSAAPLYTVGATVEIADDSGDSDAAVEIGTGGIASLQCGYLSGGTCASASAGAYTNTGNPSVTGLSASTLTISGLTNDVTYNVVVAAIDGSGNVGPQSTPEQCDQPEPVNDFFKTYKLDGGGAGGSFCALQAVGAPKAASIVSVGFGALAFGLIRRRKKGRK